MEAPQGGEGQDSKGVALVVVVMLLLSLPRFSWSKAGATSVISEGSEAAMLLMRAWETLSSGADLCEDMSCQ
jgi:hypothetical protein